MENGCIRSVFQFFAPLLHLVVGGLRCVNWQGNFVEEGEAYVPSKDTPCRRCTCDNGIPTLCSFTICVPPPCQVYERIEGECCEVRCIEAPSNRGLLVGGAAVTPAPDPRRGKGCQCCVGWLQHWEGHVVVVVRKVARLDWSSSSAHCH